MHVMQPSSLIVPVSLISVHSSIYSDSDDICDATFIDNSASKSLIPLPSSTRTDCDHACDATCITYIITITIHRGMYRNK